MTLLLILKFEVVVEENNEGVSTTIPHTSCRGQGFGFGESVGCYCGCVDVDEVLVLVSRSLLRESKGLYGLEVESAHFLVESGSR